MMLRLALLAAAAASVSATAPGVRASISSHALKYIVDTALPVVQKKFSTISIPNEDSKHGKVKVSISNGVCHLNSLGSGSLSPVPGQGIAGSIQGISVDCSAHIKAKLSIWPHPSCSFDVRGSVNGASAGLVIGVAETGGKPVLSSKSVSVNVGSFKLSFHGGVCGFVAKLINGIASLFFKNKVNHMIEKEVSSVLSQFINNDANAIISAIPLDIPLPVKAPYNIADVDFHLANAPAFDTGYMGMDVVGSIVNSKTKAPAPFPAPTIPAWSNASAAHFLQIFLSPYVLESAVWTYQQAGLMEYTVKHTAIPAGFPVQLNTDALALIAPGIKTAFPGDFVDLQITMPQGKKATITASPAGVAASVPLNIEFNAVTASGDKNAFVLGCDFDGAIALKAETNSTTGFPMITGNLSYLKCPLSVVSSNVGAVDPGLADVLLNFVFSGLVTPFVNVLLNVGLPLPTTKGLTFRNFRLINGNGYVMVATDFTYVFPSLALDSNVNGGHSAEQLPYAPLLDGTPVEPAEMTVEEAESDEADASADASFASGVTLLGVKRAAGHAPMLRGMN
ncbi:hypothetical protein FNF27_01239 [Cafeteria roenbergensis]|uniref:Lipid-binding serum glycoprotein C-terminal domain-containing protein n=1 Tax=Cafeteria roenbergensis TaxID=33653 RepID=A0A5A8EIU9_CAFRO|nr:hypothetical protein FNF27_01239 [Cafeteria roenbergensis]